MGEILRTETLSDIRYRIRRYIFQTDDWNQMKAIEGYVFKQADGLREINEFVSVGELFKGSKETIRLSLTPSNYETRNARIGDPPLLVGKHSFGRVVDGDRVKERLHFLNSR